jgi:hypothetical protein
VTKRLSAAMSSSIKGTCRSMQATLWCGVRIRPAKGSIYSRLRFSRRFPAIIDIKSTRLPRRGRPARDRVVMKAFMLPLLCALVISLPAVAEPSPQESLAAILQHDFEGDGGFRIGKAIFTSGPCSWVGDPSCTEAREYFKADADPIEVVTNWEFAGAGIVTPEKAILPVRFVAISETMDYIESRTHFRHLKPLAAPREVTVTYHLKRRGEEWVLVDPPLPRAGLSAVNRIFHENLRQSEENIKYEVAHPDPGGDAPRVMKFLKKNRDRDAAELAALDALARRMNLPLDATTGDADKAR